MIKITTKKTKKIKDKKDKKTERIRQENKKTTREFDIVMQAGSLALLFLASQDALEVMFVRD